MICRSWHGKSNVFRFLCFNSFYLVFSFFLRLAWEKVLFDLGNTGPWFGIFKINCQFMTCTTTKIGWWILTVGKKRKTNFTGDHVNEIFKACLVALLGWTPIHWAGHPCQLWHPWPNCTVTLAGVSEIKLHFLRQCLSKFRLYMTGFLVFQIMSELTANGVQIYHFPVDDETVADTNNTMNVSKVFF